MLAALLLVNEVSCDRRCCVGGGRAHGCSLVCCSFFCVMLAFWMVKHGKHRETDRQGIAKNNNARPFFSVRPPKRLETGRPPQRYYYFSNQRTDSFLVFPRGSDNNNYNPTTMSSEGPYSRYGASGGGGGGSAGYGGSYGGAAPGYGGGGYGSAPQGYGGYGASYSAPAPGSGGGGMGYGGGQHQQQQGYSSQSVGVNENFETVRESRRRRRR